MIITELPRTPTRFVFISNLVSPSSAHLNGELAWLGKWKPERQRFGVTPCDSDNVNVTRYEVAVKEANIEDTLTMKSWRSCWSASTMLVSPTTSARASAGLTSC